MTVRYVLAGMGGDWCCDDGHEGVTSGRTGVPYRCVALACTAETRRTGAGSIEANRRLKTLRVRGRERIASVRKVPA